MSKHALPELTSDDRRRIAGLSPSLTAILDAELSAGNFVQETWEGFGFYVLLAKPFQRCHKGVADIEYREVGDAHYWKAEYYSKAAGQVLACRY